MSKVRVVVWAIAVVLALLCLRQLVTVQVAQPVKARVLLERFR